MIENFREKAGFDYKAVKSVLDKRGVKFFALYGTALGAARERDFIEGDKDLDLACIEPLSLFEKTELIMDLRTLGFKVILRNPKPDGNLWFERYVPGDLYWMKKVGNHYVYRLEDGKVALKIPERFLREFLWLGLGKSTVRVPCPPDSYLTATYDKDWRTPKPEQTAKLIIEGGK